MPAPVTGRQVEFAFALGIPVSASIGRVELSELIESVTALLNGPPVQEQFQLAQSLCIQVPPALNTRRKVTSLLYEYMAARRWVFSVIRHATGEKWRSYAQIGLPEPWSH